jgi:DNA-binding CsgD family transcriptional regulator
LLTGDWGELLRIADQALCLCEDHRYPELRWPFWFASGLVAAARGQLAKAYELADRIDRWGERRASADVQLYAGLVRCHVAQASGDCDQAFREISVLGTPTVFYANLSLSMWASFDFVSCAVRANRQQDAGAFVALASTVERATLSARIQLLTRFATAIATTSTADLALDDSLDAPDTQRWPFDVARLELACGQRLRRGRSVAEARRRLTRSVTLFRELEAQPWLQMAQQELRASGGPRVCQGVSGGAALTPQEQEIAELAARGLTNRQIGVKIYLSPRTVSAHLYRIFPKLGVSSRAALRDALSGTGRAAVEGLSVVDSRPAS